MSAGAPSPQDGGKHEQSGAGGEDDRTTTNLLLLIGFIVLVGSGIWLVDALLEARRADECLSAGRRNCSPVEVSPRPSR